MGGTIGGGLPRAPRFVRKTIENISDDIFLSFERDSPRDFLSFVAFATKFLNDGIIISRDFRRIEDANKSGHPLRKV